MQLFSTALHKKNDCGVRGSGYCTFSIIMLSLTSSIRGKDRKDEPEVPFTHKLKFFMVAHWRGVVALLTPIIALPILFSGEAENNYADGTYTIRFIWRYKGEKNQWCGYCLIIMTVYWMTECIPLPVTSFLPVFIFPMTGVLDSRTTCACYFNDTICMFLGSLMLATCVEQSGLHVRIALGAIRAMGYSHYRLLFAMSFVTMFVSMWITNTAATTMMVPINFALLRVFEGQNLLKLYDTLPGGEQVASDITACYFCSITFSATIGGIGTLVGTGTNLVFKGYFIKDSPKAPELLSFPLFSAFTIPLMLALEGSLYLYMSVYYFGLLRPGSKEAKLSVVPEAAIQAAKKAVEEDTKKIGPITFWEIMVIILFGGAMVAFFCRSPKVFTGWADLITTYFSVTDNKFILDSALAMLVAFFMMLLPSTKNILNNCTKKFKEDLPKGTMKSVLDWKTCQDVMPWSYIFLLGGGFALSTAASDKHTDLNGKIGAMLSGLGYLEDYLILLIVIAVTVFITNIGSNIAMCNVVTPVAITIANDFKKNTLKYSVASGLAASFCFFLPVGTPGNLIVQSAAKVPTKKMMIAGAAPTVFSIILTWLFIIVWGPIIWPDINEAKPEWQK